ncbi:F-box/kelch-repeat protein At3g23880-like [Silene latifolia]|uniref:F-box/kelch-repeat protein At3g23880-like n=1 Tax=Silene latifolia TaxID=37657 RepID=UPI003D76DED2
MAAYRIPSDVIAEILVCLPVRSLLRFKSVCKDWYTLINSSLFIQLHLNKSLVFNYRHNHTLFYTDYDSLCVVDDIYRPSKPIKVYYWPKDIIRNGLDDVHVDAIGSCNGLVCLCVTRDDALYCSSILCFLICNPSTRTFKFKPTLPFSEFNCPENEDLSCGFGYDGEHDDYKFVITHTYFKKNVRDNDVYIYSIKADLWKCATHTPAKGSTWSYFLKVEDRVVYANNMLHYIAYSLVDDYNNDLIYLIARFDMSSETWKDDLSFPAGVEGWKYIELEVLDDCLYLCLEERHGLHNVWVMKGYRDDDYSWSIMCKDLSVYCLGTWSPRGSHNLTLFAPLKEGTLRLLFVYTDFDCRGGTSTHRVLWYNPHDATTETFKLNLEQLSSNSLLRLCITSSLVTIPGSSFDYIEQPGNDLDENKNHQLRF